MAEAEGGSYGRVSLSLSDGVNSFTLESITIPENVYLSPVSYGTLTIPSGTVVNNNATVDKDGVVTGVKSDKTVTITCTAADGSGMKGTIKVNSRGSNCPDRSQSLKLKIV